MHRSMFPFVLLACSCSAAAPTAPADAGASSDATPGDTTDAADVEVPFPAPHPASPRVVSSGGPVLASPKVVPIFFQGDTLQGSIESFLDALAKSPYWTATTKEYGVGALTIAPAVAAGAPPASMTDDDIKAWLAAQTDGTHTGWPKADASTIFTVFFPSSTSIDVHGKKSCGAFDGYHLEGQTKDGDPLVYAVLARCAGLDDVTVAAGHEIMEAATDPLYDTDPAFSATDRDHFIWTVTTAGEVADMCVFEPQANQRLVGSFMVERSWSNAAALAGHDPCVPAGTDPYFGAAVALEESVMMKAGSSKIATKGVRVPVGQTRTVDVALFSDAPTDAFEVEALDGTEFFGGPKELDLSLDQTSGKNGDVVHLTIKPLRAGPWGGSMLVLRSKLGAMGHVWAGFVAN